MSETVSGDTGEPQARRAMSGHELDASPWQRVESTLMATAGLMRETYDRALATLDLNLTEASLLAYVVESGPMKQTSIADHLRIGRAAAGNVIDRLQNRDLVERCPDPSDRRVWLVAPTTDGRAIATQITAIDVDLRNKLRLGIDRHERQMLASLLVRLQRNLLSVHAHEPSTTDRNHT